MEFDIPLIPHLPSDPVKSPNETEFPVVGIVIYSMLWRSAGFVPPPITIRVDEEELPAPFLSVIKSPKSVASPVEAIVTKSIVLTTNGEEPGCPPAYIPRVGEEPV